jgi:hypothetical protein
MRPWLLLLFLSLPANASHQWAGIDLCEVYQDQLPPGLTIEALPEPGSKGAALLNRYCTQCHNLPGPDRHTVTEWKDVASRMFMLMDVSNRFGGVTRRVDVMGGQQQADLVKYLERHGSEQALRVMDGRQEGQGQGLNSILVIGFFLLLMVIGLVRWWQGAHREENPCATR